MINERRLTRLAQNLIRLPSENPPGNEFESAMLVKREMEDIGLDVRVYEFAKRRPNVVGILRGAGKKSLLLTPHIDVVPAGKGWRHEPFGAEIKNGRIYGRGSSDCKGNVAACLEAVRSLKEDKAKLSGDVVIAVTVDEEAGSKCGLIPLLKKLPRCDAALVVDAANFDIVIAQKGLIHFKVRVFGKKAHGAYCWMGVNAIEAASKIISDMKKHAFACKRNRLIEKGVTINIGTIKGGDKVNIVADNCEFEADLRYPPGMNQKLILNEIKKIVERRAKKYKIEIEDAQRPYEISKGHELVKTLAMCARKLNIRPSIKGSCGATVMTFFRDKNIPAVTTGFGAYNQAHATDEYVKINDLVKGAKLLEEFAKEYLR